MTNVQKFFAKLQSITIIKQLFLMVICLLLLFPSLSEGASDWPLLVLTTEEREARLDFVLDHKKLHHFQEENAENGDFCVPILEKLYARKYDIISPKHVFKKKAKEEPLVYKCENSNIDTIYVPKEAYQDYDYKITPLYNRELYDLSDFFKDKEKVWGIFSEGGFLE